MKSVAVTGVLAFVLFAHWSGADDYPKNPNLDVLSYTFRVTLSDATDEIIGETMIDVRFLADDKEVLAATLKPVKGEQAFALFGEPLLGRFCLRLGDYRHKGAAAVIRGNTLAAVHLLGRADGSVPACVE